VSQADNLFTVTGLGVGVANVQITDRLGATFPVAVTVASGATAPLTVSPLAAAGTVGDVIRFEIRGGTPVYTATVANENVASDAAFGEGTTAFTFKMTAIGSSSIAVIDSLGQVQNVNVTAQNVNLTPLFTSAPSPPALVNLAVGVPQTFTVGRGSGTYLFASSDPAVVTVPAASSTQLLLTPVGVGSATVSVTDSAGVRTTLQYSGGWGVVAGFDRRPNCNLGLSAGATTYGIVGGRTPYRAVSTNAGVVSVSPPGLTSNLVLSPVAAGTANVVVTDAAGTQVSLAVTVTQSGVVDMSVSPASLAANVGEELVLTITGGSAPYTVNVGNPAIADRLTASPGASPARFRVKNAGATTITVLDSAGQVRVVSVTATQTATQVRMSPTTLQLAETYQLGVPGEASNLSLTVFGGTGPFVAYTTDPQRTSVSVCDNMVTVSQGTGLTLCSDPGVTKYDLVPTPPSNPNQAAVRAFDIILTVVDSLGASATAKFVIIDDGQNIITSIFR